jgi:hypothetical protein
MMNINRKRGLTIATAVALLCIVAFVGLVHASVYTSSASFTPFSYQGTNGYVTNLDAMCVSSPGSSYATITGPIKETGGEITCTLSGTAPSGSTVCVYAGGSGGTIYIYAYYNGAWQQLAAQTPGSATWIYGYTSGYTFTQVAIACYSPTGSSTANIYCAITMP